MSTPMRDFSAIAARIRPTSRDGRGTSVKADRERERLDGAGLARRVREHGGPDLRLLGYCQGGLVRGACRMADPTGQVLVMSSVAGDEASRAQQARSIAVLERLWSIGHPVPRYERVVDLGDTLVILQADAHGVPPARITRPLAERLLELQAERAFLMDNNAEAGPLSLGLGEDAPSHQLLREHSHRTRRLLAWIESVADRYGNTLCGPDAVHFDYHPGNVLVHPDQPANVLAIVDWDGAVASSGGFDLVTLAWTCSGPAQDADGGAVERLWTLARQLPDPVLVPSWAHMSLRLVAWCIRFAPQNLEHWLQTSERLADL